MSNQHLVNINKRLSEISPSFCTAKWGQVLFNLQVGQRHNCCLAKGQKINLDLVNQDPNALFNDATLEQERSDMLQGKKIKSCEACWKPEASGHFSDRHYKSGSDWAEPFYSPENHSVTNVIPTYVEVSFGNKCQMMCTYCSPLNSSALAREAKKFGTYKLSHDHHILGPSTKLFMDEDEDHIYAASFWEWFLQNNSHFKVLRFTGGEPLLSKWLYKFLDWLEVNPMPQVEIGFNSNLSLPSELMDKFFVKLNSIPKSHYKKIDFYTSLDGWGRGAEFARYGISLELFEQNIKKIQQRFPDSSIRVTATLNVFAFPDIKKLLEKMLEFKKNETFLYQFAITCYPISYPTFMSLKWTKEKYKSLYDEALHFIDQNLSEEFGKPGFYQFEKEYFMKAVLFEDQVNQQVPLIDLYLFLTQFKHRKKINELDLPQEVKDLFHEGEKLKEELKLEELHPVIWAKLLPWISSLDKRKEIVFMLAQKIDEGEINPWEIFEVALEYHSYLNSRELMLLWYKTRKHQHVGDELIRRLKEKQLQIKA